MFTKRSYLCFGQGTIPAVFQGRFKRVTHTLESKIGGGMC